MVFQSSGIEQEANGSKQFHDKGNRSSKYAEIRRNCNCNLCSSHPVDWKQDSLEDPRRSESGSANGPTFGLALVVSL